MRLRSVGNYRFYWDTTWGWWGFTFSLRGTPDYQDILSTNMKGPWWLRIGPFAVSWRWD